MTLFAYFLFGWLVLFNIRPISDPDLWWHLASGQYLLKHLAIPYRDVFSLTAQGTEWVNTYWLQEFFLAILHRVGGLSGIIWAKSICIAGLLYWIGYRGALKPIPVPAKLLGVVWIFLASHPRGFGWEEKASYLTLAFLSYLFYALYYMPAQRQKKSLAYLPILFMVWANMHRGFILGLSLLGLYWLERWMSSPADRPRLLWWGALCALATLANPYGWNVYGMGWQDYTLSPVHVMGWAQTPFQHLELFWATLFIFWALLILKIVRKSAPGWGFIGTSLLLSALSVRYASLYPFFVIWAVPWIMLVFTRDVPRFPKLAMLLVAAAMLGVWSHSLKPAVGINTRVFPVKAVQFFKDNHVRTPFYHEYELGGFLMWALQGEPPVLIDGRYPAVAGYRPLYPKITRATQGDPQEFQHFLENLGIEAAMVKYPSTEYLPAPFANYFPKSQWALVYWDDLVLIFLKRTPAMRDIIAQHEFRFIQPDANHRYWMEHLWTPASPSRKEAMRQDLLRNLRIHPESRRARRWADLISGLL